MKPLFSTTIATTLLFLVSISVTASHNITQILQAFPDYTSFNSLLTKYGVASQINTRTTITVLCPTNSAIDGLLPSLGANPNAQTIFDVLSYHVLLDYYDLSKLRQLRTTIQVTTLFQTTGLAAGTNGFVNISTVAGSPEVGLPAKGSSQKVAIVIKDLVLLPYNISVLSINKVLVPDGASSQPSINITQLILQGGNYSTFLSLAKMTGVDSVFQANDLPPGITIFVPTNAAFDAMPPGALSKLSYAQKVALLEYHALRSYYPLEALAFLSPTEQNTLASGSGGGAYTLTVKTKVGSTLIGSGLNSALVEATLYSNNPVALFSVSSVLLPVDIFGSAHNKAPSSAPAPVPTFASSPASSPSSAPTPSLSMSSAPSVSPVSLPSPSVSPISSTISSPSVSLPSPSVSPISSTISSPSVLPPGPDGVGLLAPSPQESTSFSAPTVVKQIRILVLGLVAVTFII